MGAKRKTSPSPSSESSDSDAPAARQSSPSASPSPQAEKSKKRKRVAKDVDELEIDVTLPEPPSKKALRAAKKAKSKPATDKPEGTTTTTKKKAEHDDLADLLDEKTTESSSASAKRSEYGVWIGNLPFTADKTILRVFLTRQGQIPDAEITRIHMPAPTHAPAGRVKPSNKGFAYVDFSTPDSLQKAIALSETLITGRKCLIKDAKSYEGRPEKATATVNALSGVVDAPADGSAAAGSAAAAKPAMAASKRVFVGNLGFDVAKEDLEEHFAQAGEIEDVHMATFEDSGKCKGFAWIRFVELEAAQAAVQGYVFKEEPADEDEEEEEEVESEDSSSDDDDSNSDSDSDKKKEKKQQKKTKKAKAKKPRKRKWFINRLHGRPLRCEFAEDASTRYKKRFGKPKTTGDAGADGAPISEIEGGDASAQAPREKRRRIKGDNDARQEQRRKRHVDARNIKPAAALANAPRASAAIVAPAGKKTTFE